MKFSNIFEKFNCEEERKEKRKLLRVDLLLGVENVWLELITCSSNAARSVRHDKELDISPSGAT